MLARTDPALKAAIHITAAPHEHQAVHSAWCFATALLSAGHSINRVFLQGDAVFLAAAPDPASPSRDENSSQWEQLITAWSLPATVCIGSAQQRTLDDAHLRTGWSTGGLGEWVMACSEADRILQFTGEQ
ncbi:DsrE/DsrF/TusD sulfur relay family protein [Vreelandella utahensis]|uniref:DsrE/DsrF/TusD sulfur relay family protein n=1 Tax=Vreelandella halophila TaxID=86177 RepID=UPI0009872FFA|nr:DsrE family protein [Halomonas utahensis]